MFSLSLGGVCPSPATAWLGITLIPAKAAAVVPIKLRRENDFLEF
jgi:hypothetical protein